MAETIITYLLIAAVGLEWLFYAVFVSRFLTHKEASDKAEHPPVSVVICVRNESRNLLEHLDRILTQQYPNYEVVVVNDRSTDDTIDVLKAFKAKYQHLKIVDIPDSDFLFGNKKYGLTLGIKAAEHEHLLFTDGDCQPVSDQWIRLMTANLVQKQVVLGYGKYQTLPGFLNKLIRYDTVSIALQYLSLGKGGLPYMGVGRNLAYQKPLFFKFKGFSTHLDIRSGDDDLFIAQAANAQNTTISVALDGQTVSVPQKSFSDWFDQKRRHITTSVRYKFKYKLVLGLLGIRHYLFWAAAIAGLILFPTSPVILSIIGARVLIHLTIFHLAMRKLGEQGLLYLSPLLEIILLIVYPALGIANAVKGPGKWKN